MLTPRLQITIPYGLNKRCIAALFVAMMFCSVVWMPAHGQVRQGIVWNPPANTLRAQSELFEMKESGVDAIRTPLLLNAGLYDIADSLGLQLYQDLPFEYLPTGALQDTLGFALDTIKEAIRWANDHPSVRNFGLGRHNDTSDAQACSFFEEIIKEARRHTRQPLSFYYITTFVEDEQCFAPFDEVMLDALNEPDPVGMLQRWRETHPAGNAGIGALGTWIKDFDGDEDGHRLRNSPAYQARYLEENLNALLNDASLEGLTAVFVYRWSDIRLEYPSISHNLKYPYRHTYGLKTNRGTNRSAYHVVRGIYTDKQRVFAFPVGQEGSPGASWIVLLGWITIALLGFGYAYFPRFSPNTKRYFVAHGFYRAAVEEGRELLFGSTALLLLVVMISFGIAGTVILDTVRVTEAFSALVRWLPATPRSTLVALLANQLVMILVLGSGFAVAVTIWTSILSAITARNRRRLLPGQTFMLVVWPQWPVLLAMIAATVISTLDKTHAPIWALVLFVLLVISVLGAAARALRDFSAITKPNLVQMSIAFLGNPFMLTVLVGIYICLKHADKFSFFWHLMTRT